MLRPSSLALLLLAAAFTGCLSGETPGATDANVTASDAAEGPAGAVEAAGNATLGRVVPIDFKGSLPTYGAVCANAVVTGYCFFTPLSDFRNHLEVKESGNLSAGTLTLTWTPSSPLSQEMYLAFYGYNDDDFHEVGFAYGASPLTLEVDPTTLDASMEYHVYVGVRTHGVSSELAGAGVRASREQAFTLEGALTFA